MTTHLQMDHHQQQGHAPVTAITTLSPAPACTPPEAGIRDIKTVLQSSHGRPNAKNPACRHFKRVHGLGDYFGHRLLNGAAKSSRGARDSSPNRCASPNTPAPTAPMRGSCFISSTPSAARSPDKTHGKHARAAWGARRITSGVPILGTDTTSGRASLRPPTSRLGGSRPTLPGSSHAVQSAGAQ